MDEIIDINKGREVEGEKESLRALETSTLGLPVIVGRAQCPYSGTQKHFE